jgi:hypothetical protein
MSYSVTCQSCEDAKQIDRIREGLRTLKDPDTGRKCTREKIELRVEQWKAARLKYLMN